MSKFSLKRNYYRYQILTTLNLEKRFTKKILFLTADPESPHVSRINKLGEKIHNENFNADPESPHVSRLTAKSI